MTTGDPDISSKLAAPTKKSVFERQKAEAEAKKAREKAETAAALEDFVKSFDDDGGSNSFPSKRGSFVGGDTASNNNVGPAPGKRHFTSSGLKSGPGSLGRGPSLGRSGPGSLRPSQSFAKKRQYDDYAGARDRDRDRDRRDRVLSYSEERDRDYKRDTGAFAAEEEGGKDADDLKAVAKPTLHLSSLPPGTSAAIIKGLFAPSPLAVDNVRVLPTTPATSDRKSISAIVTLAAETPAADIDTVVSQLQNRYLGFGFNLSISRHLSSAVLTGSGPLNVPSANLNNLPFGAKPVVQHTSLSRAPPPGQGPGRFAPPASYTSSTPYGQRSNLPPTQVTVQTPNDLKQLRLIHKTLESLLTYGPEFEALLMSRPEIQRDEQWAWLWDSRSTGGVYYRWRLWEILTKSKARKRRVPSGYGMRPQGDTIFEGQSIWIPPEENLKFEYTTKLEEFISDEDYNSSDEEDAEECGGLARRYRDHQKLGGAPPDAPVDTDGVGYLNPLAKTKLVHLLSRLPESNAKLRKGDVARITGFAIEHAGAGAEEVAALVTRNVTTPFCYNVNKPKPTSSPEDNQSDHNDDASHTPTTNTNNDAYKTNDDASHKDTTPASLVGLYIISDILSSSASAGVRHAWRYRSLLESQLKAQNIFPTLGRRPRDLNWGKLKADKWRRSLQTILSLWEGWCVFPGPTHESFVEGFLHPPLTAAEVAEQQRQDQATRDAEKSEKDKAPVSRWRSVDDVQTSTSAVPEKDADGDVDMDGTAMVDDDDDDKDRYTDENIDGVPMVDSSDEEGDQLAADPQQVEPIAPTSADAQRETSALESAHPAAVEKSEADAASQPTPPISQARRARPRAADFDDMFE
ncbi:hypothetical protein LTR10_020078 [Elasticomyces elasticus]|uniref:CID domain-containing protein n=1 Tax=Exophiala sideris TaxID=1016849 RepID=A0ABR0IV65_9EURO|nr:hypothetical protein LTR10_020078 [Elasticomyces elasticus]KAK5021340.1 hypothetical protein LTS07_011083 [Exophiala sideris]KAK5024288.1 hypothetical protein LTR13_010909 [Exophiala sideris]KAK5049231.1 hypothetical protein LTR69_011106 [Exophiala sideris]KAK5176543.1 hypothetical protein LTR44_010931 [Eurotiomycetes sp. CCFEE 6388]